MNRYLLPIRGKRESVLLAVLCFLSYASSYIGRLNYSAALPGMLAAGVIDKTKGGMIATVYFAAYGFGQLVNGFLADRHNPRIQVAIGIATSAVLNLLMVMMPSTGAMLLVWGLNGYAQSLIWAPTFLIVSQSVRHDLQAKALLLLNSAAAAGTILAYLYSGLVLRVAEWQTLFSGAAILLGICAIVWLTGNRWISRHADLGESPVYRPADTEKQVQISGKTRILGPAMVLLILPAMIHGMLKDGVTSWLPTYMTEEFSMSAENAVLFSVLLPLINISGAAVAYFMMRKIRDEVLCTLALFVGSGVCMLLLTIAGTLSPVLAVVLFALVTAAMMAVNVMLCSEAASRFAARGAAGTVSGFYNACGYIGTAVSMYFIAWIAQTKGWAVTRIMWGASCAVAALCCIFAIPLWKRQTMQLQSQKMD